MDDFVYYYDPSATAATVTQSPTTSVTELSGGANTLRGAPPVQSPAIAADAQSNTTLDTSTPRRVLVPAIDRDARSQRLGLHDNYNNNDDDDDEKINAPFQYEAARFRVYEKVIGLDNTDDDDDAAAAASQIADLNTTARSLRVLLGAAPHSDTSTTWLLDPTAAKLHPRDFSTECPTYEGLYTRVRDAAAVIAQSSPPPQQHHTVDEPLRSHMYTASVFHVEKLYALHALRLTHETAKQAMGCQHRDRIPLPNKAMLLWQPRTQINAVYRARVPSMFDMRMWIEGPFGVTRVFMSPDTRARSSGSHASDDIIVQHLTPKPTPPWLLCIDLEGWLDSEHTTPHVRHWMSVLHRTAIFPVLSATAPNVLNPEFTGDACWLPPSVWLRAPFPHRAHRHAVDRCIAMCRAIQPTVMDLTDTPLSDDMLVVIQDRMSTRRLRCLRVRLAPHSHSDRSICILERLFAVLRALPSSCTRVEIVRADFTYTQQQVFWEDECPELRLISVLLVEPISITNTLLHSLGTRKFRRLSIWKPLTSAVLHSQIHDF